MSALGAAGCAPLSFLITPTATDPALRERVVEREAPWTSDRIALLDVEGIIRGTRATSLLGAESPSPVSQFKEQLDLAARDPRVKAIVLRINSPGGAVTASDLMHAETLRFRQRSAKPVIAAMLDVAASGGYYIACAAERIYALPTSVTGSIGVIMITPDLSGLMQRVGVGANVIKSGALKDAGSPFREMREADRAVFQGMIDRMFGRFVDVVAEGRKGKLTRERVLELADGRVYLGDEAQRLGLVDEVGGLSDAITGAKRAAGLEDRPVVVVAYARQYEHRPNVYAEAPRPAVSVLHVELPQWLTGPAPEFLYLWAPTW